MMHNGAKPVLKVTVESGSAQGQDYTFSKRFRIGRHPDCEICLSDDVISRQHAEVFFQNDQWWIRDLQSANGIYADQQRINLLPLKGAESLRLGVQGPILVFSFEASEQPAKRVVDAPMQSTTLPETRINEASQVEQAKTRPVDKPSLSHYKEHYFGEKDADKIGEHTMMVRAAYAEVKKKQRWTYVSIISVISLMLVITGAVALYKSSQVKKQRKLGIEIFYTLRALELDLMKLREETEKSRSLEAKIQIDVVETKKKELEKSYDRYVDSLGIYSKDLSGEEKIILRLARRFGECEINIPKGFAEEVFSFIKSWQSSERLAKVIRKAKRQGYIPDIVKALAEQQLPPEFFYLAVQESNLNHRAVGPPTRFGYAKGMWQFIPKTAEKYGLRTGPLKEEPVVDLLDERHSIDKSTQAAARYLRDIYTTDAQASGLLVMASYNWGEERVIKLIQSMPANPRERNFWQLISKHRDKIPDETYDYVFSIFSAAVIGQNPRLFGFEFDNPLALRNVSMK